MTQPPAPDKSSPRSPNTNGARGWGATETLGQKARVILNNLCSQIYKTCVYAPHSHIMYVGDGYSV